MLRNKLIWEAISRRTDVIKFAQYKPHFSRFGTINRPSARVSNITSVNSVINNFSRTRYTGNCKQVHGSDILRFYVSCLFLPLTLIVFVQWATEAIRSCSSLYIRRYSIQQSSFILFSFFKFLQKRSVFYSPRIKLTDDLDPSGSLESCQKAELRIACEWHIIVDMRVCVCRTLLNCEMCYEF